uniref:Uncharacterized protein n=1 Tax=Timema tahoe TaxID=61484 RepID=A0A7R9FGB8_9NEOP|nr:unnamed protein product [Timema tahoe]
MTGRSRLEYQLGGFPNSGFSLYIHAKVDVPKFGEPIINVTVPVGREATLTCVVDDLATYKKGKPSRKKHPQYTRTRFKADIAIIGSLFCCDTNALDQVTTDALLPLDCSQAALYTLALQTETLEAVNGSSLVIGL